jgi:hypothetical protein
MVLLERGRSAAVTHSVRVGRHMCAILIPVRLYMIKVMHLYDYSTDVEDLR